MTGRRTVRSAMAEGRRRLADAGFDVPALEVRLLAAATLGCDASALLGLGEQPLEGDAARRFDGLLDRRLSCEPIAHILGEREFWSLPLWVNAATLVPRPDSETLIEAALAWATDRSRPWRILDLGTGTGCLLLALLSELPRAWGLGVDVGRAALAVARDNTVRCGLADRTSYLCSDWGEAVSGQFDMVITNPPYISDVEWPALPREVREFEPAVALRGGADGLSAYRRILPDLRRLLAADGAAFVEVGDGAAASVLALATTHGFCLGGFSNDLAGRQRCLRLHCQLPDQDKILLGNQMVPV